MEKSPEKELNYIIHVNWLNGERMKYFCHEYAVDVQNSLWIYIENDECAVVPLNNVRSFYVEHNEQKAKEIT